MPKSFQGFEWKDYIETTANDTFNGTRFTLPSDVGAKKTLSSWRRGKQYKQARIKVMVIDAVELDYRNAADDSVIDLAVDNLAFEFQIVRDQETAIIMISDKNEIYTNLWEIDAYGTPATIVARGQQCGTMHKEHVLEPSNPKYIFEPQIFLNIDTNAVSGLVKAHFRISFHYELWSPAKVNNWSNAVN